MYVCMFAEQTMPGICSQMQGELTKEKMRELERKVCVAEYFVSLPKRGYPTQGQEIVGLVDGCDD